MTTRIDFYITFSEPQAHYFDVTMHIHGFQDKEYLDIKMPVWTPGSYLIREYAKNVERFRAIDEHNEAIAFEKQNKNTWRLYQPSKNIKIQYSVYAFERSVRTSFVDDEHAFLSPAGTFMYIDTALSHPAYIHITLPDHWHKISTGLLKIDDHTFFAEDFDQLYDSPLEIGNHETWTFDVDGTLHECAMVGRANYNPEQLTTDISRIIQEENKIWGSNPNNYYLFVTHHTSNTTGGLEHMNSTILASPRFNYNNAASYKSYLSLVAHEYFHLWNVKRLRPKALGPFHYDEENYTTALWIMEGFTSYYDNLILRRCEIYSEVEYLQQLANDFNIVYNRPGFEIQSAAAASFDTWIKQYRPDENSHNTSISYYNKGAMLAVALDIHIIRSTDGRLRLDDVLREAYKKFYLIENRGFEEVELQQLAEYVTGTDLSVIFQAAHQLRELDYNSYFNAVGYEIIDTNTEGQQLSLGIKTVVNDGRVFVKNIDRNSPAWQAGLHTDDELISIDNYRIEGVGKALDYVLNNAAADDIVKIIASRDGFIEEVAVKLQYSDKRNYSIQPLGEASEKQRNLGRIWLSTTL